MQQQQRNRRPPVWPLLAVALLCSASLAAAQGARPTPTETHTHTRRPSQTDTVMPTPTATLRASASPSVSPSETQPSPSHTGSAGVSQSPELNITATPTTATLTLLDGPNVVYERAIQTGQPLADRVLVFRLTGDRFDLGAARRESPLRPHYNLIRCVQLDTRRSPTLRQFYTVVWDAASLTVRRADDGSDDELAIQFLTFPGFAMPDGAAAQQPAGPPATLPVATPAPRVPTPAPPILLANGSIMPAPPPTAPPTTRPPPPPTADLLVMVAAGLASDEEPFTVVVEPRCLVDARRVVSDPGFLRRGASVAALRGAFHVPASLDMVVGGVSGVTVIALTLGVALGPGAAPIVPLVAHLCRIASIVGVGYGEGRVVVAGIDDGRNADENSAVLRLYFQQAFVPESARSPPFVSRRDGQSTGASAGSAAAAAALNKDRNAPANPYETTLASAANTVVVAGMATVGMMLVFVALVMLVNVSLSTSDLVPTKTAPTGEKVCTVPPRLEALLLLCSRCTPTKASALLVFPSRVAGVVLVFAAVGVKLALVAVLGPPTGFHTDGAMVAAIVAALLPPAVYLFFAASVTVSPRWFAARGWRKLDPEPGGVEGAASGDVADVTPVRLSWRRWFAVLFADASPATADHGAAPSAGMQADLDDTDADDSVVPTVRALHSGWLTWGARRTRWAFHPLTETAEPNFFVERFFGFFGDARGPRRWALVEAAAVTLLLAVLDGVSCATTVHTYRGPAAGSPQDAATANAAASTAVATQTYAGVVSWLVFGALALHTLVFAKARPMCVPMRNAIYGIAAVMEAMAALCMALSAGSEDNFLDVILARGDAPRTAAPVPTAPGPPPGRRVDPSSLRPPPLSTTVPELPWRDAGTRLLLGELILLALVESLCLVTGNVLFNVVDVLVEGTIIVTAQAKAVVGTNLRRLLLHETRTAAHDVVDAVRSSPKMRRADAHLLSLDDVFSAAPQHKHKHVDVSPPATPKRSALLPPRRGPAEHAASPPAPPRPEFGGVSTAAVPFNPTARQRSSNPLTPKGPEHHPARLATPPSPPRYTTRVQPDDDGRMVAPPPSLFLQALAAALFAGHVSDATSSGAVRAADERRDLQRLEQRTLELLDEIHAAADPLERDGSPLSPGRGDTAAAARHAAVEVLRKRQAEARGVRLQTPQGPRSSGGPANPIDPVAWGLADPPSAVPRPPRRPVRDPFESSDDEADMVRLSQLL